MSRWLGSFAGKLVVAAICAGALFVLPIWLFGATPILSAMILALILIAIATAWVAEFVFRKSHPNLFRPFEKERRTKTFVGNRDE
jgi:hypothetical protein